MFFLMITEFGNIRKQNKDSKLDKLVSVIIPSYNHEKYIQEAIKSVINQTYKNIELLVMDDGSKDSTWQKICEMKPESKERFTQIHFETKENEGVSKTLQKLLNIATGDYIYYFSSDDIMKPEAIEILIKFLESHPKHVLAVGNDDLTDTEGKPCYWDKKRNIVYDKQKAVYYTFADFLQKDCHFKFTSKKFGTYGSFYYQNYMPNGYLVRKSALKKIKPYTPEAPLEDYFLMLQLSKYGKMKYIDKILFSYRIHDSNTFSQTEKMKEMERQTREYEEKILEEIDESEVLPEVLKVKKHGYYYKKQGIPFVFEIQKQIKHGERYRIIKLFGIKIKEYKK